MAENQLIDAEQNVIGALFLEPDLVNKVIEKVDISSFAPPNNHIVEAVHLINRGDSQQYKNVGILTVWSLLQQKKNKVSQKYIRDILTKVVTTNDFEDSLNIIADNAVRDKMLKSLNEINVMIKSKEDLDNVIAAFDKTRRKANVQIERFMPQPTMTDHVDKTDARIAKIVANRGKMTGIPSGFPRIDFFTGGWQNEFIVIGARPSMGKTALALNFCINSIKHYGHKPAFFSYEMSTDALLTRIVCSEAEVSQQRLKHGQVTDTEHRRLKAALAMYRSLDMIIDDRQYDIDVLLSKIKMAREQKGIDYAVVDYLQLIPVSGRSREEEVAYISKHLKAQTMRLEMPIIALSQLSRIAARKGGAPPELSDLRESGALEQDADIILFPHRPFYYGIKKRHSRSMVNVAEIHIAKHRNGPTGMAELVWNQPYAKFENPAVRWVDVRRGHD